MKSKTVFNHIMLLTFFTSICLPFSALHAQIIDVTTMQQYQDTIVNNSNPMVMQFAAHWCGACQNVKKTMELIAADPEFASVTFARIDIDSLQPIVQQHNISGIPTFMYKKDGAIQKQTVGVQDSANFENNMKNDIRSTLMTDMGSDASLAPLKIDTDIIETVADYREPLDIPEPAQDQPESFFGYVQQILASLFNFISEFINTVISTITSLF